MCFELSPAHSCCVRQSLLELSCGIRQSLLDPLHSCLSRSSSSILNFDKYVSPCSAPPPGILSDNCTYSGYLLRERHEESKRKKQQNDKVYTMRLDHRVRAHRITRKEITGLSVYSSFVLRRGCKNIRPSTRRIRTKLRT